MKKKKKVYIISHSHLDREWYMPFEQHHMRVVELFDALIEAFETDPSFRYFHLDGQTIPLDDYLEVKPENRGLIERYIREGRLRVGPFYILQDDFLISPEAHVRNTLIGLEEVAKYGGMPVQLGYFPDTFGNMGQTPQMMRQMGLDAAAFGRGVKPTGFNNTVAESYSSQYSEMNWRGPDGSEIFGLLFANWYSNGNEIPTERAAAEAFWTQKLADAEKYASTDHLLMMNGVDHQPLQKDVGAAIALANELFPDYEFAHSNFDEYLAAVQADLPADLSTVEGELTSQETEGWYTLANTASSRLYLKKENALTQALLENVAEPLLVLANEATDYKPLQELGYAWRLLLQNDPHDSICGCSVDAVHAEMMTRYQKAQEVAKFIRDEALQRLSEQIDSSVFSESSFPFTVYQLAGTQRTVSVQVKIEIDRVAFSEMWPDQGREALEKRPVPEFSVRNSAGEEVTATIDAVKVGFAYDLPKDAFRVAYMAKFVYLTVYLPEMAALSYQTLALVPEPSQRLSASEKGSLLASGGRLLENAFFKAEIVKDGSLTLLNKETGKSFANQLIFENVGDVGNEYVFKQSADGAVLLSTDFPHQIEIIKDSPVEAVVKLSTTMEIPVSADARLQQEQEAITDVTNRQARRSSETAPLTIETEISIKKDSPALEFTTSFDNQMKDHRLRVRFQTGILSETHQAESIFEAVERPNVVGEHWKNPTNPQHQHAFVNIHDARDGLTIGNVALSEYEVLPGNEIAVTLLRAVGEMGDWGYFPTPEAQCQGRFEAHYSLESHGASGYYASLQRAVALKVPVVVQQTGVHGGALPTNKIFAAISTDRFVVTALKLGKDSTGAILRGYSLDSHSSQSLTVEVLGKSTRVVNLLEENPTDFTGQLAPAEILTLRLD